MSALTGRTFGNWRLRAQLGEGAFGAVYEAEHVTIAGRLAAVKVLHPHMAFNADLKRRFINEASAASRAEHENIVQIFDGGITDDGFCYSVMELLRGRPLTRVIADGPLDPQRAIRIALQVASALRAAHALAIVHRDLKPDNLFVVAREHVPEFVKVLDFGVAKLHADGGQATRTGVLIGTPGYMAPEQWLTLPDIDGRADVYALGVILYQCVCGRLPFEAMNPYEWMKAHLEAPVPDPAARATLPPALARLVARMLAKKREERPQTMDEVIAALHAARAVETAAPAQATLVEPSGPIGVPATPVPAPAPPAAVERSTLRDGTGEMRPQPARPRRPLPVVPLVSIGLVVLTVAAVVIRRLHDGGPTPPAVVEQPAAKPEQAPPDPTPPEQPPPGAPAERVEVDVGQAPTRGPADAPVTIVAFSDFQCPFCSRAVPTLQALEERYPGKLRIAFKQHPLPFHQYAQLAAEASLAAQEQGKFWAYHDLLFAHQTQLERPSLEQYARQIGLDLRRFRRALDDGRFRARIADESAQAERLGANGTPTFFINGRRLVGALPVDDFSHIIDEELRR